MSKNNPAEIASKKALDEMFNAINNHQNFRLEAGAGAGKTYSLIEALKYLISEKAQYFEKKGKQIACITYTNVAKDEIKNRTDNNSLIYAETIHAFSWSLLKSFQPYLLEFVYTLSDRWRERIDEIGGKQSQKVIYDLGYPSASEKEITLHHDDVIKLITQLLSNVKFRSILISRFPILLIDEYQDTDIDLASSIVTNLVESSSKILIGLFGDHWQKIYGSKACGLIQSPMIHEIGKNANFRSEKNIVHLLNRMRPELPQQEKNPNSCGEILVFHSNTWSGNRQTANHWQGDLPESVAHEYLERVKRNLTSRGWNFESENTKILMLTNNVLASEQGYRELANCFSNTDDYLKKNDSYIKYFLENLEPMIEHFKCGQYGLMNSVNVAKTPILKNQKDKKLWVDSLEKLITIRETGTVRDVLDYINQSNYPKYSAKVLEKEGYNSKVLDIMKQGDTLTDKEKQFIDKYDKFYSIQYIEVNKLYQFVEEKTPFSTKHGVKGAEFENVLVVCGRGWNQYNWNQMFEWMANNYPSGKQDIFERNRNLFYVSCSRAKKKLAILFTQELSSTAFGKISELFCKENVVGEP